MGQCDTLKEVEEKFGGAVAAYLKNKHKGGKNNEKGSGYESNFAIFQLSNLFCQVLTLKNDIHISTQTLTFVDDLVVINRNLNSSHSYQLKNTKSITWDRGKHPIEIDFKYHHQLDKDKGIEDSNTILTVSCPELYDSLNQCIPNSIASHTTCMLFENEPLNVSLAKESDLKKSLVRICSHSEPDKLTQLHTIMKGVWENQKGQYTSVSDFIANIRKITPHFLRSFRGNFMIDSRLSGIFDNLEGFSYEIFENQLNYSYSCDKSGFSFDGFFEIDSTDFKSRAEVIIKENPSTFVELLGLELL